MTDLLHIVPQLDVSQYSHIIPSLEKAAISSNDLLTLDALDLAKRAQVPLVEVRRLAGDVLEGLHSQFENQRHVGLQNDNDNVKIGEDEQNNNVAAIDRTHKQLRISTLDSTLDAALGGGFPAGRLSEVTGESAAGKTQLLLSLCLAVQLPAPHGLGKSALYITTEAPLQTTRLSQILQENPLIAQYESAARPSLHKIHSAKVGDVEAQEHILRYQVPVAISRNNVGLIVIDSIAANYRAEFDRGDGNGKKKSAQAFAERSKQLTQLGTHLRELALKHNIAIVTANQVLDRFTAAARAYDYNSQPASQAVSHRSDSGNARQTTAISGLEERSMSKVVLDKASQEHDRSNLSNLDLLNFDHQQRFFTGWGDLPPVFPYAHMYHATNLKTPSLGLAWTNQLSARLVLLKEPIYKTQDYLLGPGSDIAGWRRTVKVAYGQWCSDSNGAEGIMFEIWSGGIRAFGHGTEVEEAKDPDLS